MAPPIDPVARISPQRDCWRIKVRLVRMWSVPSYNNPSQPSSIEMILADEAGGRIQATVRRTLVYKFQPVLEEGATYRMSYFSVIPNLGSYKPTSHDYRLVFLFKTTIVRCDAVSIPLHGLALVPFSEVFSHESDFDVLVDVIGLLTAISEIREYERDGVLNRMAVMELTSDEGKLECALFGSYVQQLEDFLGSGDLQQPIVVVQFAKVKLYKGKIVIQNSIHATRLLFNPDILEVAAFRSSIAEHFPSADHALDLGGNGHRVSFEEEFMRQYPRRTMSQLVSIKEDGHCIVLGTVDAFVEDLPFWYTTCSCNNSVVAKGGLFYCDACCRHAFTIVPRFRLKVVVSDPTGSSLFVLFDKDATSLLKKTCPEVLDENPLCVADGEYPSIIKALIGRQLLFKVETKSVVPSQFVGSFTVRRICEDEHIIHMFTLEDNVATPIQATFTPSIEDAFDCGSMSESVVEPPMAPIAVKPTFTASIHDEGGPSNSNLCPATRKLAPDFDLALDVVSAHPLKIVRPNESVLVMPDSAIDLGSQTDFDLATKTFLESLILTPPQHNVGDPEKLAEVPVNSVALAGAFPDECIEFVDSPEPSHQNMGS